MTNEVPRIVVPSVAPEPLYNLLSRAPRLGTGSLAILVLQTQVSTYETQKNRAMTREDTESRIPSLFDATLDKVAGSIGDSEDVEECLKSMEGLPPNVLSRAVLRTEKIPYDMCCRVRQSADEAKGDLDEWVLRNEVWLRDAAGSAKSKHHFSKKFDRRNEDCVIDRSHWAFGVVRLSTHADVVFPNSLLTNICRIITRSKSLPGFKILDSRRPQAIRTQPSVEMFRKTFEAMTDDILKGLDWENVFVAGGIVLGTLLCTADTETTSTPEKWKNSDIDLYIHGLGPVEANKKMEHIFSVFKSNLGEDAPVLVVRNSKTITFFSKYPTRRVQIVLKLVDSPKDVLLNFDLDVCAVGWDGEEVWMLPRAARALETGYTVFTMDLINGHYLGDRRATQEQRIFKYAERGFGIRILPTYLEGRQAITNDPEKRKLLKIDDADLWDPRNFDELVNNAREWTRKFINEWEGRLINQKPFISHLELNHFRQNSEDPPGRSMLSGLSLFMRHVALWEHEVACDVVIEKENWALPTYNESYSRTFGISYNDTPNYSWDEQFTNENFISMMTRFNDNESCQFIENVDQLLSINRPHELESARLSPNEYREEGIRVQRITHASSLEAILQPECDIFLPVWLPETFFNFANNLIPKCVRKSASLPNYTTKTFLQVFTDLSLATCEEDSETLRLVIWHITSITMWQQLDRIIDEVHEILWSFYSANAGLWSIVEDDRLKLLVRQFGRRAIRMTSQDEYGEFARWVARKPLDV